MREKLEKKEHSVLQKSLAALGFFLFLVSIVCLLIVGFNGVILALTLLALASLITPAAMDGGGIFDVIAGIFELIGEVIAMILEFIGSLFSGFG